MTMIIIAEKSYMDIENLSDVWRTFNPLTRFFTWHRGKQKSRLDYFFASDHLLNIVTGVDILPGFHSDHSLLRMSFQNSTKQNIGKGFWKFNCSLLHDKVYVDNIRKIISNSIKDHKNMEDKRLTWEFLKLDIRNFTVPYSINKKRERNSLERTLNKQFISLHNKVLSDSASEQELEDFNLVKKELESVERHKARGAILRSKCRWSEEGEKNSSYFLRLEKQNFCNKLISQLKVDDRLVNKPDEILKAEKHYYEELYSNRHCASQDTFEQHATLFTSANNIPKIPKEIKDICDLDVTQDEILNSLSSLKNNKSPGSDGLVAEFYKFFWNNIKDTLLECIKYALEKGELSIEQKRGVITLIPKKDKNRLYLNNWRPITLLNVDYKILAKVLSNRLCKALPQLIDEDQTGYIKGRFIGCNIRIIEDVVMFTQKENISGILLNIDFEKAFDSIDWRFIDKSLEIFNFGTKFRKYIKTLYCNISTAIINNGEISDWFNPLRGVRQGCPISPYLFLLTVELLAINIRQNSEIKGINIGNSEIKLTQLADDTTCFVQDLDSVKAVLNTFDSFNKCAALKVNKDKTKAYYLGNLREHSEYPFGLDWSEKKISSLGVIITGNENDHYECNFKKRLINMSNLLNQWKCRNLSLKGKVTVVNTLAVSPLLYLASVIWVPDRVIKEAKSIITDFIWNGKPSKISYNVLIQDIQHGGLKLIDFEQKVKALKGIWVKRFTSGDKQRWKAAPAEFLRTFNFFEYFASNQGPLKQFSPKFYQDVHNAWSELHKISDSHATPLQIQSQTIWNNRYITIDRKPYTWGKWRQHGVNRISDLINDTGEFLSHNELNKKFNIQCNFLNALQVRQSIPIQWRTKMLGVKRHTFEKADIAFVNSSNKVLYMSNITCSHIYWHYVNNVRRACFTKWTVDYPALNNSFDDLWGNIFQVPFKISHDTLLQSFQYKIIHRIIPCKEKLFVWKIEENSNCNFCNENDDIRHFFLLCPKVKDFWLSFFNWWNHISSIKIPLNYRDLEESILFGFQMDDELFEVLDYCILLAKYFIYKHRIHNDNIDFYNYLFELKFKLQVNSTVYKNKNMSKQFKKYLFIFDALVCNENLDISE